LYAFADVEQEGAVDGEVQMKKMDGDMAEGGHPEEEFGDDDDI